MLVADAFVDFEQDTLCPASVDAFEKGNEKSPPVNFSLDQDVRSRSSHDIGSFFWIIGECSLGEVILYEGHPAIAIPDGEHF